MFRIKPQNCFRIVKYKNIFGVPGNNFCLPVVKRIKLAHIAQVFEYRVRIVSEK